MRWVGHVACVGEGRNVYRVLVAKLAGKRLLERPRRRWDDGIKITIGRLAGVGVEWIHLAQDRDCLVGSCERGDEHSGSGTTVLVLMNFVSASMILLSSCLHIV
jgi:hypothetical protein